MCPGNRAGDGKCEQACGAHPDCDENDPGYNCGTRGRCTFDCLCCEASDSDNGINYNVKGTTTALQASTYACKTETDFCIDFEYLREWYVTDQRYLSYTDHNCYCRNGQAGCCYDGRCVECLSDSDCPAGGSNNLVKGKCDSPQGTDNPETPGYTYTCYWPRCRSTTNDCISGSCCTSDGPVTDPNSPEYGKCVGRGIYPGNTKYLCDPPGWGVSEAEDELETQSIFKSIMDLFLHFFVQR